MSSVRIANSNSGTLRFDQLRTASGPLRDAQLARVHAARLDGDEGLRGEALVLAERALRGLLPRGVAVEGEDHLAGEDAVVHEQPAQHADVLGCRTTCRRWRPRSSTPDRCAAITSV